MTTVVHVTCQCRVFVLTWFDIIHFNMEPCKDNIPKRKPKLALLEIEEDIFLDTVLTSNGADVIVK